MSDLALPTTLQARLDALPEGLRNHINRVRDIARDLAGAHAIDQDLAELTAAMGADMNLANEEAQTPRDLIAARVARLDP